MYNMYQLLFLYFGFEKTRCVSRTNMRQNENKIHYEVEKFTWQKNLKCLRIIILREKDT